MPTQLIIATIFAAFFAISVASAQHVDRFLTEAVCIEAVKDGTAVWYQPSFFDHRTRPPSRPVVTKRPLEQRACAEMWIVGGWHFVPQPGVPQEGDKAPQFDFDADGNPIRRTDCGNRVRKIVYVPVTRASVPESLTPPPPPQPLASVVKPACSISGDALTGFVATAVNGTGECRIDGKVLSDLPMGVRFHPATQVPGIHTLECRAIAGDAGDVCTRTFLVRPAVVPTLVAAAPKPAALAKPPVERKRGCGKLCKTFIAGGAIGGAVLGCKFGGCFGGGGRPPVPGAPPANPKPGGAISP